MKVYKYLLSVIVMLGMISCSSEENDIINEVAPTAGQLTVAFNLSNEVATTKAVGDPTDGEANINTCALFICTSEADNATIISKGFFNGSSCTFNFKPEGNKEDYYVYAVANVSKETFSGIDAGDHVSNLKNVTTSISSGVDATNLPKMGGMTFKIKLNSSEVQNIGEIPVYQLVSSLQLQMKTAFTGGDAEFQVTNIKWDDFSASGRIGGDNQGYTNSSLSAGGAQFNYSVNTTEWMSVGSQLYTFPNISSSARLFVQGNIVQNGQIIADGCSHTFELKDVSLVANTKYNVQITATGTLSSPTNVSFDYQVIPMETISVDVPSFD